MSNGNSRNPAGKHLVLIVDDELVNRELLKLILENDYDTLTAEDGESALKIIREKSDRLSLILLDLLMPGMHGLEVIRTLQDDPELKHIPVIVLTADQKAEVESLRAGAVDFLSKPYPEPEVILARVGRIIEMTEDREIIELTERDGLTGLLNRDYFYRYARQIDLHHADRDMDAMLLNICHFRMINERYGKTYGDMILRQIGEGLRNVVRERGGIASRRDADIFLIYSPHREDYQTVLDRVSASVSLNKPGNRIRLRMGIYANADHGIDMERRFDRAKMAADTVSGGYKNSYAFYDSSMHEKELFEERLLEGFDAAIRDKQFKVYYQPKFDIRPDTPVLASAEALVRWDHPELGFINPMQFIPLFETNGLIRRLDEYVWQETAERIRDWKDRLGISTPVSVNVSRVDMYDSDLVSTLLSLVRTNGLTPDDFLLEITESAYTNESAQIIDKVNQLRTLGFHIEMDDFGTGYSSLNMVSELPIDALKLDMTFIRNAFAEGGNTRLIEIIVDIADFLAVPVIAEGVETEKQLRALKAMGCDLVQGYYFSPAVPPEEFEQFILEKKHRLNVEGEAAVNRRSVNQWIDQEIRSDDHSMPDSIVRALSTGFEVIYYIDTSTGNYVQFSSKGKYKDLMLERSGSDFFEDARRDIVRVVFPEDQERVSEAMRKDFLLDRLAEARDFSITYRLIINSAPVYYHLRAVRAYARGDDHIVIGVSNIQETLSQAGGQLGSRDIPERGNAFFSIAQALSSEFESIYYVDTITDDYTEFTARGSYEDLEIELSGTEFFTECRKNIPQVVYSEDQSELLNILDKDEILHQLSEQQAVSVLYRLMISGVPTWYRLKIVMAEDKRHLVIGLSNVDSEISREKELEASQAARVTFASISQALAADYFSIYYVDTETDRFIEYSAHDDYEVLGIEKSGDDFFNLSRTNIVRVVHPDDREKILQDFTKERLLSELNKNGTFTLNYRLMFGDKINYVSLKATKMADSSDKHIVIGVNNINAQMQRQLDYDAARALSDTYSRIAQALSRDYYSIYLVNIETDEFIEYSSSQDYKKLHVEQNGVDFFKDCRRNVLRLVYKEDMEKALAVWDKSRLMQQLENGKVISSSYRLMINEKPVYINCKIIRMEEDLDNKYIVIGISNIDEQMRREQEITAIREKANRDALTGTKSKHAYVDMVAEINTRIDMGTIQPFAVVVCDVNGLKTVNDTLGHQAGDKLICSASEIICRTFKHSPVFRVGGDEFVAILNNMDYTQRDTLMAEMLDQNRENMYNGGVVIACGISEWDPDTDNRFEAVFDRADSAMYDNKLNLKSNN